MEGDPSPYLRPSPLITSHTDDDNSSIASPGTSRPNSPSASTFLRTAETLQGLASQLEHIRHESGSSSGSGILWRCCCEGPTDGGCRSSRDREAMEEKLKLSGEIGNALLQRYEALERKHQREVDRFEHQLEVKKTALAESVRRVYNLEKANVTHLQKFSDMAKKSEALEKRYTQALHTQTLTQQSLTHVRAELSTLRATTKRQSIALLSGAEIQQQLADAEKRYEEARDNADVEARKARDEERKRKRAEARIAELEGQLALRSQELDAVKDGRAKDAQELLANAKDRLADLHAELSATFGTQDPSESPEYQRALEDLVASNALLKHDASELSQLLSDSRLEVQALTEEVDELRAAVGVARRESPDNALPRHLASEILQSKHSRTESSPNVTAYRDRSWARMSVQIPPSTRNVWDQHTRRLSTAPSIASTADGSLQSPGLGMGPVGEYGGSLLRDEQGALSPPPVDGRQSPKPIFRTSPSGGIGYVLNGVPKNKNLPRPPVRRSISVRERSGRSFSSIDAINEWEGEVPGGVSPREPESPATSDYFRLQDASRKRRSLRISQIDPISPRESADYSPSGLAEADFPSPMSESALQSPADAKRPQRRTLLLLTRSQGTQTDPEEQHQANPPEHQTRPPTHVSMNSTGTSAIPPVAVDSETSSLHDARPATGLVGSLADHLSKLLNKLRSADVPTLNRRLKKQHLPVSVGHLSRSTMRNLQAEVAELRHLFKSVSETTTLQKREFNFLLKLFKDIFNELIDLQGLINDITIEPSLAKKLQKEAYREEEEGDGKASKQPTGLGWIAAPITKFFVTPAEAEAETEARPSRIAERNRLAPVPGKSAPKIQASTSATTTHVSVEFGGAGIVRRATPATAAAGEGLPSPDPMGETGDTLRPSGLSRANTGASNGSDTLQADTLAPRRPGTLRPSKSRANRNELLGIFAGAPKVVTPPWVVVPSVQAPIPDRGLPPKSKSYRMPSGYIGERTVRQNTHQRNKLSTAVDAVIDRTAEQIDSGDPQGTISFQPPLLERTLRPRGLSDSSIRSTYISQESQLPNTLNVKLDNSRGPLGASMEKKGYLESIAGRFYNFRASNSTGNNSSSSDGTKGSMRSKSTATGEDDMGEHESNTTMSSPRLASSIDTKEILHQSPAKTIAKRPQSVDSTSTAMSHSSSVPSQGILGMLANSLSTVTDETIQEVEEDELRGGRLRKAVAPTMGRTASNPRAWQ